MDTLRTDLTFALRVLCTNAKFAASVVVTLAVGIGAASAMFGVVNGVLLSPLPIREQGRVVGDGRCPEDARRDGHESRVVGQLVNGRIGQRVSDPGSTP